MKKLYLTETVLKLLDEGFRDTDKEINKLKDELYDIIQSVDFDIEYNDLLDYECDEDMFYQDDIDRIKELQDQIKNLYNQRELEYKSETDDLPPKTDKTNFEGFDITKTDPPFDENLIPGNPNRDYYMKKYNYQNTYIAEMTPDEYLLLCGKYGWGHIFDNVDDIYEKTAEKSLIDEYAEKFKKGEKAPMPTVDIKEIGQEGRHRAFAAKKAGIKTIPVLIKI